MALTPAASATTRKPATPKAVSPLSSVSIIIPTHNEERTFERCPRAAANQSVPAAETIVVDNRSTDDTAQVTRQVARENPAARVRVVPQFNALGLSLLSATAWASVSVIITVLVGTLVTPDPHSREGLLSIGSSP